MTLKPLRNQKGFSFIEAILTTAILSIALWGSFAVLQNATNHSVHNDLKYTALTLANEKVESIIADKTFNGYDYIDPNNYPEEAMQAPFSGFTRNVTITEIDPDDMNDMETPSPGSGYKRVDVNVVWGTETFETVTVSTVVTDYS